MCAEDEGEIKSQKNIVAVGHNEHLDFLIDILSMTSSAAAPPTSRESSTHSRHQSQTLQIGWSQLVDDHRVAENDQLLQYLTGDQRRAAG